MIRPGARTSRTGATQPVCDVRCACRRGRQGTGPVQSRGQRSDAQDRRMRCRSCTDEACAPQTAIMGRRARQPRRPSMQAVTPISRRRWSTPAASSTPAPRCVAALCRPRPQALTGANVPTPTATTPTPCAPSNTVGLPRPPTAPSCWPPARPPLGRSAPDAWRSPTPHLRLAPGPGRVRRGTLPALRLHRGAVGEQDPPRLSRLPARTVPARCARPSVTTTRRSYPAPPRRAWSVHTPTPAPIPEGGDEVRGDLGAVRDRTTVRSPVDDDVPRAGDGRRHGLPMARREPVVVGEADHQDGTAYPWPPLPVGLVGAPADQRRELPVRARSGPWRDRRHPVVEGLDQRVVLTLRGGEHGPEEEGLGHRGGQQLTRGRHLGRGLDEQAGVGRDGPGAAHERRRRDQPGPVREQLLPERAAHRPADVVARREPEPLDQTGRVGGHVRERGRGRSDCSPAQHPDRRELSPTTSSPPGTVLPRRAAEAISPWR